MEYMKLPIDNIKLDLENPRIIQWMQIYEKPTRENIALALSASSGSGDTSTYNILKESIRMNGGIINPIMVNRCPDGSYVVVEGNTRVQIYRELRDVDPEGPWDKIIAIVYDNMPEEKIHAIRLQSHLVGPRDWEAFSKAKYLNQLSNIEKLPMALIVSFCGGKKNEIIKYISAYNDMMNFYQPIIDEMGMELEPRKFSFFHELQNSSITDALITHHYSRSDFARWVIEGNLDKATNVRQLPRVLSDKKARDIFLKNNISEAEKAIDIDSETKVDLSNATLDELTIALIRKIRTITHSDVKALAYDPACENEKNNILSLLDEVKELVLDIDVNSED